MILNSRDRYKSTILLACVLVMSRETPSLHKSLAAAREHALKGPFPCTDLHILFILEAVSEFVSAERVAVFFVCSSAVVFDCTCSVKSQTLPKSCVNYSTCRLY